MLEEAVGATRDLRPVGGVPHDEPVSEVEDERADPGRERACSQEPNGRPTPGVDEVTVLVESSPEPVAPLAVRRVLDPPSRVGMGEGPYDPVRAPGHGTQDEDVVVETDLERGAVPPHQDRVASAADGGLHMRFGHGPC